MSTDGIQSQFNRRAAFGKLSEADALLRQKGDAGLRGRVIFREDDNGQIQIAHRASSFMDKVRFLLGYRDNETEESERILDGLLKTLGSDINTIRSHGQRTTHGFVTPGLIEKAKCSAKETYSGTTSGDIAFDAHGVEKDWNETLTQSLRDDQNSGNSNDAFGALSGPLSDIMKKVRERDNKQVREKHPHISEIIHKDFGRATFLLENEAISEVGMSSEEDKSRAMKALELFFDKDSQGMQAVTCIANQRLWTLGGAASEAGHRSLGNQMKSRIGPYEGTLTISSTELTYDISRTDDGYQIRSSSKMNIELIQDKNGKNISCNSANSWQKVEFQIEISHASILEGKPAVKIIDPPKGQFELDIRTIE